MSEYQGSSVGVDSGLHPRPDEVSRIKGQKPFDRVFGIEPFVFFFPFI